MLTIIFYLCIVLVSYILQRTFGFEFQETVLYSVTLLYFLFEGILSLIPSKYQSIAYTLVSLLVSISAILFYGAFKETGQLLSITFIFEIGWPILSHFESYLFLLIVPIVYYTSLNFSNIGISSFIFALISLNMLYPSVTDVDLGRLDKQWNREYIVEKYGYSIYQIADLAFNIPRSYGSFEKVEVVEKEHEDNAYTGVLEGTNLIVIHAESFEQFTIGMEVNGQEVTPFMNELVKNSIYFDNFYSQVSLGTSSDSEITFNTGLLPTRDGCTSINHFSKIQNALPELFVNQGYTTMSFHANNGNFWNRKYFHQYLGYQTFYSMEDFEIDEEIGLGLSDMSFFRQVLEIFDTTQEPFMASVIMLTNHTPFRGLTETTTLNLEGVTGTKRYLRYLTCVHYADSALRYLFNELDEKGYLENTTIVLYGDHGASLGTEEQNQKVPFLIYSKRLTPQVISKLAGMYDCLPTIANMYNLETAYTTGTDLMSDSEGFVLFVDGAYIGTTDQDIDELLKINEYVVRTRS